MVEPLPEEDETPDEEDRPEDDEVLDEDVLDAEDFDEDVLAEDALDEDVFHDEVPDDVPEDLLAGDEVLAPDVTCLTVADAGVKVAPMPAAAAAASRLICQVILLTRRWPASLDWRAAATVAAG